ncbi:MAG: restriction endonuclease subunit S [Oscillospiraceae bacterium]|nr:restriction endonuclease subunit S [Oscillospiraceae bacterium]
MSEWRETTLGELCSRVITGGTPDTKVVEYYRNGTIPWVKTKEVNYRPIISTDSYITTAGLENSSAKMIPADSIIVAMYGQGDTAGRVAVNKIPVCTNQACCNLVIDDKKADYRFIYYVLTDAYEALVALKSGSAQPNLNTSLIKGLDIIIPDVQEQRAIAEVLSSLDDKIDLLTRQNATLEALAQTYFRQWMKTYSGVSRNVGDFLETTLGGEWGKDNASDDHPMPVCCIRGTDVAMLMVGLAAKIPLRYIKPTKYDRIALTDRDIILEISGGTDTQSTGRATYINDRVKLLFDLPIVFSNFCRCLRFKKKEYIHPFYLYIKGKWENGEFFNLENGSSGIHNLDYKSFLNSQEYADAFPNDEEFSAFATFIDPFFEKIDKNKIQIQTLQKLRDTLLPKLISGEVKVHV